MTTDDARREPRQTKRIVLLVVLLAAIGGWWGYRWWSTREWHVKPVTHKPSDFLATWRCLSCGFEQEGNVGVGPKPCPQCQKNEMYVHFRQACLQHGTFLVAYQYDQQLNPSETKIGDAPWKPIVTEQGEWNLVCPVCAGPMIPAESPRLAPRADKPAGGG
jgi:hypothetical protein